MVKENSERAGVVIHTLAGQNCLSLGMRGCTVLTSTPHLSSGLGWFGKIKIRIKSLYISAMPSWPKSIKIQHTELTMRSA